MKRRWPMGTVISGTLRSEDLIPAFIDELKTHRHSRLYRQCRHGELVKRVSTAVDFDNNHADSSPYFESTDADNDLEDLMNALDLYAAPYHYFGAHPGNGSDFGYWLQEWEDVKQQIEDGGGMVVNGLDEVPPTFRGEVAVVNDHGNVTLYHKSPYRQPTEVWSVV